MNAIDTLNADEIRRHGAGFELEIHEQLESTQDQARMRVTGGDRTPAAILSDAQTGGRGQRGRHWHSPAGSALYLTAIWPSARSPVALSGLSLVVGLAIRRTLRHWQLDARLKWPNDVLVDQRKLAGVLIEVMANPDGSTLLIGIGLNLQLPAAAALAIDQPWTELARWLHPLPSRNHLIGLLLIELERVLKVFETEGFATFAEEWQAADALMGSPIWLHGAHLTEQGQALGVSDLGKLQVLIDGQLREISAGDVSVRLS